MLMCMCVWEDGIISLMVLTHLVLSHDSLVGLSHVTIVELPTVRLSSNTRARAAGVTWLLLLHKQGSFVCCCGAVSHTVILSALCMQHCVAVYEAHYGFA